MSATSWHPNTAAPAFPRPRAPRAGSSHASLRLHPVFTHIGARSGKQTCHHGGLVPIESALASAPPAPPGPAPALNTCNIARFLLKQRTRSAERGPACAASAHSLVPIWRSHKIATAGNGAAENRRFCARLASRHLMHTLHVGAAALRAQKTANTRHLAGLTGRHAALSQPRDADWPYSGALGSAPPESRRKTASRKGF